MQTSCRSGELSFNKDAANPPTTVKQRRTNSLIFNRWSPDTALSLTLALKEVISYDFCLGSGFLKRKLQAGFIHFPLEMSISLIANDCLSQGAVFVNGLKGRNVTKEHDVIACGRRRNGKKRSVCVC